MWESRRLFGWGRARVEAPRVGMAGVVASALAVQRLRLGIPYPVRLGPGGAQQLLHLCRLGARTVSLRLPTHTGSCGSHAPFCGFATIPRLPPRLVMAAAAAKPVATAFTMDSTVADMVRRQNRSDRNTVKKIAQHAKKAREASKTGALRIAAAAACLSVRSTIPIHYSPFYAPVVDKALPHTHTHIHSATHDKVLQRKLPPLSLQRLPCRPLARPASQRVAGTPQFAAHEARLGLPDVRVVDVHIPAQPLEGDFFDFSLDRFLRGAHNVDVLARRIRVMATNGLAITLGRVGAAAVHEERVKEDGVAGLHVEPDAVARPLVVELKDAVIRDVHCAVPLRVTVFIEDLVAVRARHDDEAAVCASHLLHCRP
mmetsp:Transcript_2331/g.7813  ORF Transcript_2331/g.7813 Transcript_2331/m.7813 type:complete len:371 (+) Transcript_2331:413-1525(+)